MMARAIAEAAVDLMRALQAKVDRGAAKGSDPDAQTACREALATIDAYLATLPPADQGRVSKELVTRFMAPPAKYVPTVQPKARTVVSGRV